MLHNTHKSPLLTKLEDAIHRIIVRRSAPDWLPFLPGSSYWVPPPRSRDYGLNQLVEKLANLRQNTWTYSTCTLVTRHPSQWDLLRRFWQSIAGTRRLRGVQYVVTLSLSLRTSVVAH